MKAKPYFGQTYAASEHSVIYYYYAILLLGQECVTNFRWAVSLSGFANMSTKITTKWEFRLSLSFLLSENT